jgi:hypothetical protein
LARALLVGCGCRGRLLGVGLRQAGWAVRGTSRTEAGLVPIAAAGFEPALADPDRPGTILDLVADVTVVFWLLGSASGEPEGIAAIHGPRLRSLLERLVDTPVRGFVYEGRGTVAAGTLEEGAEVVGRASRTWRIPAEIVTADPAEPQAWVEQTANAADRLLTRPPTPPPPPSVT